MLNRASHPLLEAKQGCSNAKTGVDTLYQQFVFVRQVSQLCGLMQQRSFGVRRFDVDRHERSVTWCYAESSLTNCHRETGVRHYRMQTHVHRTYRYVCMYGVRVLVSRSPSVVNLSLYRLCSARRVRLGFDCAAV